MQTCQIYSLINRTENFCSEKELQIEKWEFQILMLIALI